MLGHDHTRVVLSRANFVDLLPLEVLNRRLVEFEFAILILVVAIGVDVGGDRRNRLVLVDVDQMLQYLWLGGGVCAHCLRSHFVDWLDTT